VVIHNVFSSNARILELKCIFFPDRQNFLYFSPSLIIYLAFLFIFYNLRRFFKLCKLRANLSESFAPYGLLPFFKPVMSVDCNCCLRCSSNPERRLSRALPFILSIVASVVRNHSSRELDTFSS